MIIGISGKIASGKNTVAKIINDTTQNQFEERSFAGKLKQIASLLTGIPIEKFEDQEFKKTNMGDEWNTVETSWMSREALHHIAKHLGMSDDKFAKENNYDLSKRNDEFYTTREKVLTVRELLQKLGTEAIRNTIHPNAWVNALFADYIPSLSNWHSPDPSNSISKRESDILHKLADNRNIGVDSSKWIITDVRFENEAKAITDRGGIVIRVNRSAASHVAESNMTKKVIDCSPLHSSETALDSWKFDYVINNNAGIPELVEEVAKMTKQFNIK